MGLETWSVLAVAGAFFLLGIAGSPLAWVAMLQRRWRSNQVMEQRFTEVVGEIRRLEARLARAESRARHGKSSADRESADPSAGAWADARRGFPPGRPHRAESGVTESIDGPSLISVPNLAAAPIERDAAVSGLTHRYAAIWTLADRGAAADVIAKATGQPIGQIELILGLRRQIDATRTSIPHAPHTRT